MEHFRTDTHQFCDTELVMIIDIITGKPIPFGGPHQGTKIGTMAEAMAFMKREDPYAKSWAARRVIVKLDCIAGFSMEAEEALPPCQSTNHTVPDDCYGGRWTCLKCGRVFCYNDGCDDDHFELCDDCAAKAWEEENVKQGRRKKNS